MVILHPTIVMYIILLTTQKKFISFGVAHAQLENLLLGLCATTKKRWVGGFENLHAIAGVVLRINTNSWALGVPTLTKVVE
jgi:hypothetical protein